MHSPNRYRRAYLEGAIAEAEAIADLEREDSDVSSIEATAARMMRELDRLDR